MKVIGATFFGFLLSVVLAQAAYGAPPADRIVVEKGAHFEKRSRKHGLVDSFPQFPVVSDAQLINSYDKTEGDRVGYEAVYHSQLSIPEVVKFYEDEMTGRGWTVMEPPSNRAAVEQSITFKKGRRLLVVAVEAEDDYTEIVLEVPIHQKQSGGW